MASRPAPRPAPGERPARGIARAETARRRLLLDRLARWAVTAGGLAIIASILAILLFVVGEVLPLLGGADVAPGRTAALPGSAPEAVLADEYRTLAAVLGADDRVRAIDLDTGGTVLDAPFADGADGGVPTLTAARAVHGAQTFVASTADGRILVRPVDWRVSYDGARRRVEPALGTLEEFVVDPAGRPLGAFAWAGTDAGATAVARTADGRLALVRVAREKNFLSGGETETRTRREIDPPIPVDVLVLDAAQRNLYGGSADGRLVWWRLADGEPTAPVVLDAGSGVTALTLLIGDRSLIVGHADGSIDVWFPLRGKNDAWRLARVRGFDAQHAPIRSLSPSMRDKGFLALDAGGGIGLYHSTSGRTLWTGSAGLDDARALFFTPKSDAAVLAAPGRLAELRVDNPHPEISLGTLFGRVWYEGYPGPDWVWQSSGGSDDFEPKLSLTPLMFGTLKGTLYSLFLAIPLGVLGAMYTSQFMHPSLKRYVKPTVEIMAALPSVVLGFLAGLWLAPRLEQVLPGVLLMLVVLPLLVLAAGQAWRALPLGTRNRFPSGVESVIHIGVIALGMWLCLALSRPFENAVFDGSVQDWLLRVTGLASDQRNAVVVGLAMGFAVIPIIFSIAEDAFSNVPRNLVSASLALGATRWQTVTRVVLPSASPGIFSAVMIGFGRAVGETMIVLMATGNTPLMDWNPFNGFRTLSANIAVEIPEAPQNGTLYRTLFLAALILFVFTFLTNTVAELVRQRLRKRYAQL